MANTTNMTAFVVTLIGVLIGVASFWAASHGEVSEGAGIAGMVIGGIVALVGILPSEFRRD